MTSQQRLWIGALEAVYPNTPKVRVGARAHVPAFSALSLGAWCPPHPVSQPRIPDSDMCRMPCCCDRNCLQRGDGVACTDACAKCRAHTVGLSDCAVSQCWSRSIRQLPFCLGSAVIHHPRRHVICRRHGHDSQSERAGCVESSHCHPRQGVDATCQKPLVHSHVFEQQLSTHQPLSPSSPSSSNHRNLPRQSTTRSSGAV